MELQHPLAVVSGGVDGDILQVLASADGEFTDPQLQRILPWRSLAGREMTPDSDLDILLIRDDSANASWFDDSAALAEAATAWTGNDARIVDLHVGDLGDDAVQPLLKNIAAEDLVLSGERSWLLQRL